LSYILHPPIFFKVFFPETLKIIKCPLTIVIKMKGIYYQSSELSNNLFTTFTASTMFTKFKNLSLSNDYIPVNAVNDKIVRHFLFDMIMKSLKLIIKFFKIDFINKNNRLVICIVSDII